MDSLKRSLRSWTTSMMGDSVDEKIAALSRSENEYGVDPFGVCEGVWSDVENAHDERSNPEDQHTVRQGHAEGGARRIHSGVERPGSTHLRGSAGEAHS